MILLKAVLRMLCKTLPTMACVTVMSMKVSLWGAHHQSDCLDPGPAGERGLRTRSRVESESWEELEKGGRVSQRKRRLSGGEVNGGSVTSYLPAAMLGALAHMRVPRGESD